MASSRSMSAAAVAAGLVSFPQQIGRSRVGSRAGARAWFDGADFSLHPTDVEEALGALEGIARALHAEGDPRAAFPDIYGIITRRVGDEIALGQGGIFQEPQFISRLAGRFARRYMDT